MNTKNKKKILFTIWSLSLGGAERSLINLLAEMPHDNYDIDILLFNVSGEFMGQLPPYVNILKPSKEILFLNNGSLKQMKKYFSLKCLLLRFIYKLIHQNKAKSHYNKDQILWERVWKNCVPKLSEKYDVAIGYMHSIPSYYVIDKVYADRKIIWVHHDYSKLKADLNLDFEYYSNADTVVTVSEICREKLCDNYPSLSNKFIVLKNINSAVVINNLAMQFIPKEYEEPMKSKTPILISIGRLHEVKGYDMAINAAKKLKESKVLFRWFIIGQGNLEKKLKHQIIENGLQEEVILLGKRSNPYPYIKYANIVVQTSRNEGKSMVLDEAKILCKPIVSTNYDSASDQIDDYKTGLLVDITDTGIYKGIKELLENEKLVKHIVRNHKEMNYGTTDELKKHLNCFEWSSTGKEIKYEDII